MAAQKRVPPDPRSAQAAREFVRATFAAWEIDDEDGVVELLVSEVVTNVIRYAKSEATVSLHRLQSALRVEVHDHSPLLPILTIAAADSPSGRGLMVLERAARAWGVESHIGDGKTVWFEVTV